MTSATFTITHPKPFNATSISSPAVVERKPHTGPAQYEISLTKLFRSRDQYQTLIAVISNYGIIAAAVAISESTNRAPWIHTAGSQVVYLLAVAVIASRMRAFENLVHEASHNNLFATASWHQRLELLYAFPVFRIVQDYRQSHVIHHQHLGDPEKDPDVRRLHDLGLQNLPDRPYWYLFGLPMTGFLTYEYLTTTFREFWASSTSRVSKTLFWATIMLVLTYNGLLDQFLKYYLVPFFVILPVTRYWAETAEHLGLDLRGSFGNSRTNIGFIHRWYLNPHNDGYHAVHHLNSQVPFHQLPDAHRHLMEKSEQFRQKTVISHSFQETCSQMIANRMVTKDSTASIAE